jgi:hypothetical protein
LGDDIPDEKYQDMLDLASHIVESKADGAFRAVRRARFSIISSVRQHTVAGLIVKDLFRGFEFWLVDEGLESSLPDEAVLATRLYTLEGFAMTAGVLVPLDIELIEYAIADTEAG